MIRSRHLLTLGVATLSITLGALPIFLVGSLAILIRPDLGFGELGLGALASIYYLSSAICSIPGGWLADSLGSRRAMALAAVASMTSCLGIALLARSWGSLALFLVIAGTGNGLAFPASNRAVTRGMPDRRRGLAFGIKESAGPYATIVAGLMLPLFGLTIGWRWAFVAAAVATLPILWRARGADPRVEPSIGEGAIGVAPLWIVAGAAFVGFSATTSLGAFYVESAVSQGTAAALTGSFLSIGSFLGVAGRAWWGSVADRRPSIHFLLVSCLLAVGGISFMLLGVPLSPIGLLAVTISVFAIGWGWPSVLNFATLERYREAPGKASGIIGAGQFGGGMVGPVVFGLIVERRGYSLAWLVAGSLLLAAAALVLGAGRAMRRGAPLRTSSSAG